MQIRCNYCHRPFSMKKDEAHSALDILHREGLSHYNVYCPHCRKANRVSKDELLRFAPDWHAEDLPDQQVEQK